MENQLKIPDAVIAGLVGPDHIAKFAEEKNQEDEYVAHLIGVRGIERAIVAAHGYLSGPLIPIHVVASLGEKTIDTVAKGAFEQYLKDARGNPSRVNASVAMFRSALTNAIDSVVDARTFEKVAHISGHAAVALASERDSNELAVESKFKPSERLVKIVKHSAKEHADSAFGNAWPEDAVQTWVKSRNHVVQEHIATKIENMFHILGNRVQFGAEKLGRLSYNGKFSPRIQHEISNRIFVGLYEAPEFLNLLYCELVQYLKRGGKFGGDWGKIILDAEDNFVLSVNPVAQKPRSTWKKATITQY